MVVVGASGLPCLSGSSSSRARSREHPARCCPRGKNPNPISTEAACRCVSGTLTRQHRAFLISLFPSPLPGRAQTGSFGMWTWEEMGRERTQQAGQEFGEQVPSVFLGTFETYRMIQVRQQVTHRKEH